MRGRSSHHVMIGFAAAAAAIHGGLLFAADAAGFGASSLRVSLRADGAAAHAGAGRSLPSPTCEADVGLAAIARLVYCATPLADATCADDAAAGFQAGLVGCRADITTEIALLDAADVDALDEILAEPLMPELDPAAQAEFEVAEQRAVDDMHEQAEQRTRLVPRDAQIVEITRPDLEQAPEHTRFVSEYDSAVAEQTVAHGSTEDMVARPEPRELATTPDPRDPPAADPEPPEPSDLPEASDRADSEAPRGPSALSMREPGGPEQRVEEATAMTPGAASGSEAPEAAGAIHAARGSGDRFVEERRASDGRPGRGGGGGRPPIPNLRPSEDVLERAVGGGSVDHLEDVRPGEATALNTIQWKHASFFNRMKRSVARQWHPAKIYSKHDPSGHVYGVKDRITHVRVTLKPSGEMIGIHITKVSGVDVLDDEAVRAFRAAQPFPHPPAELVDAVTGLITFSFKFHFEVGDRGSAWRIFLQQ